MKCALRKIRLHTATRRCLVGRDGDPSLERGSRRRRFESVERFKKWLKRRRGLSTVTQLGRRGSLARAGNCGRDPGPTEPASSARATPRSSCRPSWTRKTGQPSPTSHPRSRTAGSWTAASTSTTSTPGTSCGPWVENPDCKGVHHGNSWGS